MLFDNGSAAPGFKGMVLGFFGLEDKSTFEYLIFIFYIVNAY